MKRPYSAILGIVLALGLWIQPSPAEPLAGPVSVTIGTGGTTGVYYSAGGAIARSINKTTGHHNIWCTVEPTDGSVFNINAVLSGDMEFGIAQSDRQYQAVHGTPGSEWENRPQKDLRAAFNLHNEVCTLIAAEDTGIKTLADLKGKTVTIGNPGSGHRKNALDALAAAGIDWKHDLTAEESRPGDAPALLQNRTIDAFFYTIGHPSPVFKEATMGARKVVFIPVAGKGIDALLASVPYYTRALVPVLDNYFGAANDSDVESFGVTATVITSTRVPDAVVYAMTKEIIETIDTFRKLHPAFRNLTVETMTRGFSAPIHPGALKFYREAGLD